MPKMRLEHIIAGMIETNVYFVMNDETKELIIVDPADEADRIIARIDEMGGKPAAILLTHGHFDHILAAHDIKEKYGIPIAACGEDAALINDSIMNYSSAGEAAGITIDNEVKDGDILDYAGFEIHVMQTPGHTWGSVCYYFPNEQILLSGDTLFRLSYGRTDFATGSPYDMQKSIERLLTELPPETKVYPGHMGFTDIGTEQRYNPLA